MIDVEGLQKSGMGLVFVGFFVAAVPHVTAILFGRFVLKMNPIILLGSCCGAGTITAALRSPSIRTRPPRRQRTCGSVTWVPRKTRGNLLTRRHLGIASTRITSSSSSCGSASGAMRMPPP